VRSQARLQRAVRGPRSRRAAGVGPSDPLPAAYPGWETGWAASDQPPPDC
jgi:hypothetical protein